MRQVASEDKVTIVILASLRHDMITMMPCASNDVILDNHLTVSFRESEATNPAQVLEH